MRRPKLPDILQIWGITWVQERKVRVGPAIADPEDPLLRGAVEAQRIIRQHGRYVMLDPSISLDRFGWEEGDLELIEADEEDG